MEQKSFITIIECMEKLRIMKQKLNYKEWVKKYFDVLTHDTWTSVYEKVELGFVPSDLSYYTKKDLKEYYTKYLDGTEDFLKYDEK